MSAVAGPARKACDLCPGDRVRIGRSFVDIPRWRQVASLPLVYLPIFVALPFGALGAVLLYWHLRLLGAKNLKTYWDFLPDPASHRYDLANQVTRTSATPTLRGRLFWIFNCTHYCPKSVALCEWVTYLVKLVENWWCPFGHDKKANYADAAIDQSYWHISPVARQRLHPDDLNGAIWNDERDGSTLTSDRAREGRAPREAG